MSAAVKPKRILDVGKVLVLVVDAEVAPVVGVRRVYKVAVPVAHTVCLRAVLLKPVRPTKKAGM